MAIPQLYLLIFNSLYYSIVWIFHTLFTPFLTDEELRYLQLFVKQVNIINTLVHVYFYGINSVTKLVGQRVGTLWYC